MPFYVGIDVSKWKHDVLAVDQDGAVVLGPIQVKNYKEGFASLPESLEGLGGSKGDVHICMESTGHYHLAICILKLNYVSDKIGLF